MNSILMRDSWWLSLIVIYILVLLYILTLISCAILVFGILFNVPVTTTFLCFIVASHLLVYAFFHRTITSNLVISKYQKFSANILEKISDLFLRR